MSPFLIFLGLILASHVTCDCEVVDGTNLVDGDTGSDGGNVTDGTGGGTDDTGSGDEGTNAGNGGSDDAGSDTDGNGTEDGGDSGDGNSSDSSDGAGNDPDPDGLVAFEAFFEDGAGQKAFEFGGAFDTIQDEDVARTDLTTEDAAIPESDFFAVNGTEGNDRIIAADVVPDDRTNQFTVINGGAGDDYLETGQAQFVLMAGNPVDPDNLGGNDSDYVFTDNSGRDVAILQGGSDGQTVFMADGDELFMAGSDSASVNVQYIPNGSVMLHDFDGEEHSLNLVSRVFDPGYVPVPVGDDTEGNVRTITYQNGFQIHLTDAANFDPSDVNTNVRTNDEAVFGRPFDVDPNRITANDIPTLNSGDAAVDALVNDVDRSIYISGDDRDFIGEPNSSPSLSQDSGGIAVLTGDDLIAGFDGNDELYGEQGRDVVIGGAGDDELTGGLAQGSNSVGYIDDEAADVLFGGTGEDDLYLFPQDVAFGGDGEDRFEIYHGERTVGDGPTGEVKIMDFNTAEDVLFVEQPIGGDDDPILISQQAEAEGDTILTLTNGSTIRLVGVIGLVIGPDTNGQVDSHTYLFSNNLAENFARV